jgi:hypothetical protein
MKIHTTQNNKLGTYLSSTFMDINTCKHIVKQTNNFYLEKVTFPMMVNDQN